MHIAARHADPRTTTICDRRRRGTAKRRDRARRSLLTPDLTPIQLASAPVLTSLDALLIDDLTNDEDDAFAAALDA